MWGTDAPHPEGSAPHTTEALRATLFDVPEPDLRAMLGENAARLYGFDLDALAPIAARSRTDSRGGRASRSTELPAAPRGRLRPEDPLEALLA